MLNSVKTPNRSLAQNKRIGKVYTSFKANPITAVVFLRKNENRNESFSVFFVSISQTQPKNIFLSLVTTSKCKTSKYIKNPPLYSDDIYTLPPSPLSKFGNDIYQPSELHTLHWGPETSFLL